jgi:nitroimidazol reductase NimA-like FMN-containing flavoprotein (pyridoxamine 5'-phosphate oxidase superfamily)
MTVSTQTIDHGGDMSRRVARRRAELGLSIEDVASKAGIDPGYLRYFEENAEARLSTGSTLLLALALQTTPAMLRGQQMDVRLGSGRAGVHPELDSLTPEQCERHLEAGGIGRVVYTLDRGPVAVPVNFEYADGRVVISTDLVKANVLEESRIVGFEIDRVDDVLSEGWSVLLTGTARRVDDPDEIVALSSLDLESWAGGDRHALVVISPKEVTGRVIVHRVTPDE